MKKHVLLIVPVIALLAACATKQKLIARTWKFSNMEVESAADSATQAFMNDVSAQMKANLMIEMAPDSSYTIMQLKEGRGVHGKWWFSADKKLLITKTDLGLTQYKILKLNKNVLVYESKDERSGHMIKITCVPTAGRGSK